MPKYGPKAQKKVSRVMHEWKQGRLKSGRSGQKVKSRKQAVAIAISEARKSGGKVPPRKRTRSGKKTSGGIPRSEFGQGAKRAPAQAGALPKSTNRV